jgi:hypothetical protein
MIVNIEKDDLRRAIAKIGGIQLNGNGHQAGALWGSMARDAHADRRFNFVPGVGQVFKRSAGLPVDRMVCYLIELEYLKTDDLTELEDKLQRVIAGDVLWSAQKSAFSYDNTTPVYGYYPEFEAPEEEDEPEEVRTITAEEQDAYGDIIAFLMGDIEELPTNSDDTDELPHSEEVNKAARGVSPVASAYSQLNRALNELPGGGQTTGEVTNSYAGHELPFADVPYKSAVPDCIRQAIKSREGERMKSRSEWIKERLSSAPPESREKVKRLIIETLENMERKRNIDLTEEKKAVTDA